MSVKSFLLKQIVRWNMIPYYVRWEKSIIGTGVLYADIMEMLHKTYGAEGVRKLNEVMYSMGVNQANDLVDRLGLEKTLEGCGYTLMAMHRVFGIKSKIVHKSSKRVVIHVTHCYWGGRTEGWTLQTCASIAHYETGLVQGILPSATHKYTKKHTLGDEVCELTVSTGMKG